MKRGPQLVSLLLLLLFSAITAPAEENGGPTFTHQPVAVTKAGEAVPIKVTLPTGLTEVRLYFKTLAGSRPFFVAMAETAAGEYQAALPPAKNRSKGLDYRILFQDSTGQVFQSKEYRLLVLDDSRQRHAGAAEIAVSAEQGGQEVVRDFAVPLRVTVTTEPLLAVAVPYDHPPITVPGPGGGGSGGGLIGLGGVSATIAVGGVGISIK